MIWVIVHVVHFKNEIYGAIAALLWYGYSVFVDARGVVGEVETMLVVCAWTIVTCVGMNGGIACMV